ncbi:Large polyvalent protein associated domain-containing protein, partial [Dysosmobacter welbionis]
PLPDSWVAGGPPGLFSAVPYCFPPLGVCGSCRAPQRAGAECSESSLDAQIGQDAARQRHQGEYRHQLCLTPAGELQVVVQGGHLEEPLAVGQLEVTHLDNIGQRLQNVDDAYGDQHQGHIEHKGQGCHCAAQKQAAGVPHEHLGRVVVIDEEGCQPSRHSRREQSLDAVGAPEDAGYGEERHHHKGDAGSQPVDAVGQIHSVDAAHNDEGREDQIHDPVDGKAHVQEGDIQVVGQQALVPHQH